MFWHVNYQFIPIYSSKLHLLSQSQILSFHSIFHLKLYIYLYFLFRLKVNEFWRIQNLLSFLFSNGMFGPKMRRFKLCCYNFSTSGRFHPSQNLNYVF